MKRVICKTLGIVILILVICLFVWSAINYSYIKEKSTQEIEIYGIYGLFFVSFILELIPQYVSPHAGILAVKILDINYLISLLAIIFGSATGSLTGFEIGRRIKKHFLVECFNEKKIKKIKKGLNKKGRLFVLFAAISPLPYIPLLLGMLHLSRKNFVFYGVLIRTISFIIIGGVVYFF
jgi:membrane protein YqaA with SNARE-associated domain